MSLSERRSNTPLAIEGLWIEPRVAVSILNQAGAFKTGSACYWIRLCDHVNTGRRKGRGRRREGVEEIRGEAGEGGII